MPLIDLTPFGFTPTESLVYEVLLRSGPGTGYAIARTAGLARANVYSALEGLVTKGAARSEGIRPKRYTPEDTASVLARIAAAHGEALDRLSSEIEALGAPGSPSVVEVKSPRAALQLISRDAARATTSVALLAPPEAYPLLAPALRRPAGAGVPLQLLSTAPVSLDFASVSVAGSGLAWPGTPLISLVDDRTAVIASRQGSDVRGHWTSSPVLVAAARLAISRA
ncbi:MAG TPA: helix-turn-helix domain-containing protein [Gemmatimonadales bacterium]|jgi:sugar-specific transcriptional regulator TrmB|nr:helix-turn-helix domain-containing protein [Gemmatimonadales bacterium]